MAIKQGTYKFELIGKSVKVLYNNIFIKGLIIDETKETIKIIDNNNIKKMLLKHSMEIKEINGTKINIDGKTICLRPQDRIKLR